MSGPPGPLGILPGMTFDPITNRYYSTPRSGARPPADAPSSSRSASASLSGSVSSTSQSAIHHRRQRQGRASVSRLVMTPDITPTSSSRSRSVLPPTGCPPDERAKRTKLNERFDGDDIGSRRAGPSRLGHVDMTQGTRMIPRKGRRYINER